MMSQARSCGTRMPDRERGGASRSSENSGVLWWGSDEGAEGEFTGPRAWSQNASAERGGWATAIAGRG